MTNQEYIDNRLATYNEAFDFYMDCGEMPKSIKKVIFLEPILNPS